MGKWKLSERSRNKLVGVHPSLQILMKAALEESPYDFGITEGLRTPAVQKILLDAGKSTTMNSRHITGHAVDIAVYVDGQITWDFQYYKVVAEHVKAVAKELKVDIEWGGDWKSLVDGPHFQLKRTTGV
jgi:peptidoglycan L-alanyl-D-glutamate endopeptidase CwlK